MKYATLALLGIGLMMSPVIAQGQTASTTAKFEVQKSDSELKTVDQKIAYTLGLNIGKSMKQQGVDVDPELVAKGIRDGMADKPMLTEAQIQEVMTAFRQQMMAKQAGMAAGEADKALKAGQAFLAANKAKPGVQTLPSGVQFKVLKEGTGKTPKASDTVVAHYKGTLIDGQPFDSSYDRGEPSEFPVGGVIKGWTEILQKMKVGSKYQVFIPSELAYGATPRPGGVIKPNDALVFEIELIDVK